jgi:hypothetical protein
LIKKDIESINELSIYKLENEKINLDKIITSVTSHSEVDFIETIKRIIIYHSKVINCAKLNLKLVEKDKELKTFC